MPFCNTSKSLEARLDALVASMTTAEKASQLVTIPLTLTLTLTLTININININITIAINISITILTLTLTLPGAAVIGWSVGSGQTSFFSSATHTLPPRMPHMLTQPPLTERTRGVVTVCVRVYG